MMLGTLEKGFGSVKELLTKSEVTASEVFEWIQKLSECNVGRRILVAASISHPNYGEEGENCGVIGTYYGPN